MRHRVARLAGVLQTIARRLSTVLDPRVGFTYQKSVVHGRAGKQELEVIDWPTLERCVTSSSYVSTDEPGTYTHRWSRVTLRLSITEGSDEDGPSIREEIATPKGFSSALFLAIIATCAWVYMPDPIGTVLLVAAAMTYGILLVGFLFVPSPLARYIDELHVNDKKSGNDGRGPNLATIADLPDPEMVEGYTTLDQRTYCSSCIGPPMTALLGGLVSSGPVFLTGTPLLYRTIRASPFVDLAMFETWFVVPFLGALWMLGFWVVGLLVGSFIYAFEADETRIKVFPFDLLAQLGGPTPELTGGYFSLLGIAGVPLVALSNSYFLLPAAYRLSPSRQWVYFQFPAAIIAASLPVFVYWWVVQNREYVYGRTIAALGELPSMRARVGTAAAATALSYVVIAALVAVIQKYWSYLGGPILNQNSLPILEKPVLVAIVVASVVPALYLLGGLAYQLCSHIVLVGAAFLESEPVERSPTHNYPVRVLPTDRPRAFALAFGPWKYVFISTGLYRRLTTRRQFLAILTHEEAHLQREDGRLMSDAQLGMLLPVIGVLTLTGKNVLYALANYRERENAADDFAATIVGEQPLIEALNNVDSDADDAAMGSPFVPFPSLAGTGAFARPSDASQAFERYFGLLFGSFALTRAHPSVTERRNRLEDHKEYVES